ncbi:MAG TPA: hypothetical protein VKR06_04700 [Ktedonosporobacter sp.]|nr:hypothetical protein [Ktedonosporobacter sp.]
MAIAGFSLDAYQELLLAFQSAGYAFSMFEEIDQRLAGQQPFVVLRHDIDISLRAALEVARVEYDKGMRATYFVPLNSPFYNTLSSPNATILCQIHEMGHQIALHVDLRPYYGDCANALNEVEVLARFYPYINPHLVSLHSPIALNREVVEPFPQLNNVYSHFLNNQVAYISDSTGRWRYGHPLDSEAFYTRQPIQLLTHPIWWTQEGESPRKKLEYWLQGDYQHNLAVAKEYLPKLFRTAEV